MRLESAASLVRCVACGSRGPIPDDCGNCSGKLLTARRPGLEALYPLAKAAITIPAQVVCHEETGGKIAREAAKLNSGLLLGTRAALSLCDRASVGMVGWIDADGEARLGEHDSHVRAFSLIWESMWRGISPGDRRVLIQTRRPERGWQRGLNRGPEGWRVFWRSELEERRELDMPPFSSLVRVEGNARLVREMEEKLSAAGCECWVPDAPDTEKNALWVRTKKLSGLRRTIAPFFHITRAKTGYPTVTVWHE
jgi:primosomal protein N' (replication factor Y)